jgi:hypothetical protein
MQSTISNKENLETLIILLAQVNDADKGTLPNNENAEKLRDAHWLANKFISHVFTILHLIDEGNTQALPSLRPFKLIFVVPASIDVLTRATMEAFLVFHCVFYKPTTIEERDYRFLVYKATGIAERHGIPETLLEHKEIKAREEQELKRLESKLECNAIFQGLTEKQREGLFSGKERNLWRWNPDIRKYASWSEITADAGLSKMLSLHMYRHLSGYAHSSNPSVLQMGQALLNKETGQLIESSISTLNVLTANMIQEYCELFPKTKDVLNKSKAMSFVKL